MDYLLKIAIVSLTIFTVDSQYVNQGQRVQSNEFPSNHRPVSQVQVEPQVIRQYTPQPSSPKPVYVKPTPKPLPAVVKPADSAKSSTVQLLNVHQPELGASAYFPNAYTLAKYVPTSLGSYVPVSNAVTSAPSLYSKNQEILSQYKFYEPVAHVKHYDHHEPVIKHYGVVHHDEHYDHHDHDDYHEDKEETKKYKYGYRVSDPHSGAEFGHSEVNDGHVAKGYYHVLLPDGRLQNVKYWAGPSGYNAVVTYESYHH